MALAYLQLFLLFGCFLQTNAFEPARGAYFEDNDERSPARASTTECKDLIKIAGRCENERARRGCRSEVMQRNCAKTCHVCDKKAPAPPKAVENCKDTTYGCCWDGKTTQRGYLGQGCPECKDDEIYAALCGIWEKYCHNTTHDKYYDVVQKYCHKTCNNCFVPRAIEQTIVVRTLPPAIGHFADSDDSPRRGAIYVWTKLFNPYGYDQFDRQ